MAYELGTDELTQTTVSGQPATTSNTRSYPLPGGALAERDGSGLYYLATDQLGTPIASLRLDDGVLTGTQLRTPYGQARYSSASASNGGMHSSFGFIGQREDVQAAGRGHAQRHEQPGGAMGQYGGSAARMDGRAGMMCGERDAAMTRGIERMDAREPPRS